MDYDELIEDLENMEWYCEDSFNRIKKLIIQLIAIGVPQNIVNDTILELIQIMREEYGD